MVIKVENICKKYGRKQILSDVSFSVKDGECVGILGGNGCGKSTLLSIIAGVRNANCGTLFADEIDLFKNKKKRSELIGYVPQGTPLLDELTAYDNLCLWYGKRR